MMNCVIGLDIGTTVIKCCLLSQQGEVIATENLRNNYQYGASGTVEFNSDGRYLDICELIRLVAARKHRDAAISGLCISGASGNALLLDSMKQPLMNAVSWLDNRASSTYTDLIPFSANEVFSISGWPLSGRFPFSFFAWMQTNETALYNEAKYHITDFIYYNYRLTGNFAIDKSTATNYYLVEQEANKYYQPFLNFLLIDKENLPEIVNSGEVIGSLTAEASKMTSLPEGTPVIAGSFDHPAAARGAGVLEPGQLLLSCGTSWVLFAPFIDRKQAIEKGMLVDPFLTPSGPWGAMISFTAIGQTIDRYLDFLFNKAPNRFTKFDDAVIESFNIPVCCKFDLLQKNTDPEIYLENLLKEYGLSSVCRAIMESMATLLLEKVEFLQDGRTKINRLLMSGGFSGSKIWPQILADKLKLPIQSITGASTGCVGSCILAGIGIGWWKNEQEGFNRLKVNIRTAYPQ